jgi:SulP family sulfate permease
LGSALRRSLQQHYGASELRADLLAGMTVGVVALPLSMALAIACDVPPQQGLYTAIVAGVIAALLGGSKFQVTGPTAAFVVVITPVVHKFGLQGLLIATALAGLIQLCLALVRAGRLIMFIPAPVTTGFTAGIAVVIATLQLKDLLGLPVGTLPESYLGKVETLWRSLPEIRPVEAGIAAFTLLVLLIWPRVSRHFPGPLVALALSALLVRLIEFMFPAVSIRTLGSTFSYLQGGISRSGIPQLPPLPALPWSLPGPDGLVAPLTVGLLEQLVPAAFAIAILGAIESLLSATVADGMTNKQHDPDAELMAQGVANVIAPFFGGFAATGALARTATNIRSGARSPLASVFHSLFVLLAMLLLAPLLGALPLAGFAALLLVVAWNMSDARHFVHILRVAPRSDVMVLLVCFFTTVIFDMVRAVTVGVILAAVLFIRRMAEISGATLQEGAVSGLADRLPPGTVLYRIAGPLFFGAASKALSALGQVDRAVTCVILDFSSVPAMDATGLVNLEAALERLRATGCIVILSGVQPQPLRTLGRAGILPASGQVEFVADAETARQLAVALLRPHASPV